MTERSLLLIKPEGVKKKIIGEIITRFERAGLDIIGLKLVDADQQTIEQHYMADDEWMTSIGRNTRKSYEEKGIPFPMTDLEWGQKVRANLMNHMKMGPVVAIVIEGVGAVKLGRKMVGNTEPASALPGTIRGDYAHESYQLADELGRSVQNIIHAAGAVDEAEREIAVWFTEKELAG